MTFIDSSTESVLGVRELLDRLAPVSKAGVACAGELRFYGAGDEQAWRDEMERLVEAEQWCAGEPSAAEAAYEALAELPLIDRPLRKARVVGVLGEAELFCVKRFLFYANSLTGAAIDLLNGWGLAASCPTQIDALMEAIHPQKQPTPRFHLTSELSDELDELRIELRRKKKLERKLRDGLETAVVADHGGTFDIHGTFRPTEDTPPEALERDDRLTHTHGGWKLADPPLRDYERDLDKLEEQLEELEHEIRARLSAQIAEQADWLEELADIFARLDVRLAKVRLRRALDGCWPQWCDQPGSERGIAIEGGREPRVARLLDDRPGEDVQLVDIAVDDAPVVITGPNMGGKSVLLRLIGICQWCAQHALPAPAQSCRFSPVDAIIYVGSEEPSMRETTQGLSSFGREVRRLVDWWDRSDGDTSDTPRLWLLDDN
ncbi:MAG: MutS-related protein [Persicimonas sp.]